MWKIPVIEKKREGSEDSAGSLVDIQSLPIYYMGDYSEIGILVDGLEAALEVLQGSGWLVQGSDTGCGAEVITERPEEIRTLLERLTASGIASEVGDVIDGIYRG